MKVLNVLLSLSVLTTSSFLLAGTHRVKLTLPAKAAVAIEKDDRLLVAPFVLAISQTDDAPGSLIDVQMELADYLSRTLRRKKFHVHVDRKLSLPTANLQMLKEDTEFWKESANRYGAAYVISGSVDFRVEDRSEYETQEFVSKYDNRTYLRQILVEKTGFYLEILLFIFDHEGNLVKELPLKTFLDVEVRNYDQLQGFFESIYPMEEPIVHLFVPHRAQQRRYVFGF